MKKILKYVMSAIGGILLCKILSKKKEEENED